MTVRKSKASTSALRHRGVAKKVNARAASDVPADAVIGATGKMLKELPNISSTQAGDDKLIAEFRRGNPEPLKRRIEQLIRSGDELSEELQTFFAAPATIKVIKEIPNIWSALPGDDKLI